MNCSPCLHAMKSFDQFDFHSSFSDGVQGNEVPRLLYNNVCICTTLLDLKD